MIPQVLYPKAWAGFTAVFIIVALVIGAAMANGAHKTIRSGAWVLVAVVAVVAAWNEINRP